MHVRCGGSAWVRWLGAIGQRFASGRRPSWSDVRSEGGASVRRLGGDRGRLRERWAAELMCARRGGSGLSGNGSRVVGDEADATHVAGRECGGSGVIGQGLANS